jgi:hypothetical protein
MVITTLMTMIVVMLPEIFLLHLLLPLIKAAKSAPSLERPAWSLFFADPLEGRLIGRFHIHETTGTGIALHVVTCRSLSLRAVTNRAVAVTVTTGRIGCHIDLLGSAKVNQVYQSLLKMAEPAIRLNISRYFCLSQGHLTDLFNGTVGKFQAASFCHNLLAQY